jgi:hypothetical protein
MPALIQVCAWCRRVIHPGLEPTSYGICDVCLKGVVERQIEEIAP